MEYEVARMLKQGTILIKHSVEHYMHDARLYKFERTSNGGRIIVHGPYDERYGVFSRSQRRVKPDAFEVYNPMIHGEIDHD